MTSHSPSSEKSPDPSTPGPAADSIAGPRRSLDPYVVLGLDRCADDATVRARYLELVRLHPPDRDPDRFSEIRHAYEAASNPLVMADRIIESARAEPRPWKELLDEHAHRPPRLPNAVLMSLGNRRRPAKIDDTEHENMDDTEAKS